VLALDRVARSRTRRRPGSQTEVGGVAEVPAT
jgi:hypothetical protein